MGNAPHPSSPRLDWLSYLAHDFKVPLEHIRQNVFALESMATADEPSRDQLVDIAGAIRRELQEAESLRSSLAAHLELDTSEPQFHPVRLDEVVHQLAGRLDMDAALKEIELDFQAPPGPVFVEGDLALLSRLFQNVILNAIENTPRLGFVGVEIESGAEMVRVIVSDTGPGIPADIQHRLVDGPEQPAPNRERRPDGRGLGLAFVRRVIDLHGGRARIEPGLDEGSRFIIEFHTTAPSTT